MKNPADVRAACAAASALVDIRAICANSAEQVMEKYYLDPELNPHGYFLRAGGKLPLAKVLLHYITEGGESRTNALIDMYWDDLPQMPSEQALSKACKKISIDAALDYLHSVNVQLPKFAGSTPYLLYDVDGTDVLFDTYMSEDTDPYAVVAGSKTNHSMHATVLFNVLQNRFQDLVIDPDKHKNEIAAACKLMDAFKAPFPPDHPCRYICAYDRGFESYAVIAHAIKNKLDILLRVKDYISTGILGHLDIKWPDRDCWDIDVKLYLTYSKAKKLKEAFENLRVLDKDTNFDLLAKGTQDVFPLEFRAVRIEIAPNHYECLITTLPRDEFPPKMLKKLYSERWNEEVAFRGTKYTVGALYLHSRDPEQVKVELIGALTAYNLAQCMMQEAVKIAADWHHGKYQVYHANLATSVHVMRLYLTHSKMTLDDALTIMAKDLIPERPMRPSYPRNDPKKHRRRVYLTYRVA